MSTNIKDKLMLDRQQSLASVFISLVKAYFSGFEETIDVITHLALRVKIDRQLLSSQSLEEKFYDQLFEIYDNRAKSQLKTGTKKPKSKKDIQP
jgi:hypothetical protein